jgi:hypothetical protein
LRSCSIKISGHFCQAFYFINFDAVKNLMIIMGRTFHFSRHFSVLFITLAFLLVFSSCIFGRKGRKCDCPTWSYEIPASEEPPLDDAARV